MQAAVLARFKRRASANSLWMYVIAVLAREPIHAYGVRVRLRERFGIRIPTSTVYTILYRLADEGLVERIDEGGMTLYRASEKGLKALREALSILRDTASKIEKELEESLKASGQEGGG